jgi:hypothetical protein
MRLLFFVEHEPSVDGWYLLAPIFSYGHSLEVLIERLIIAKHLGNSLKQCPVWCLC